MMNSDKLKNDWDNLGEYTGASRFSNMTTDQFLKSRSGTVYSKMRSTVIMDLALKTVFGCIILVDLAIYRESLPVIVVLVCLLVLLILTYWIEVSMLNKFAIASDPGQSSRENLSSMLSFLERKSLVPIVSMAATQVTIFVPGILLYFEIIYGYLKPITPLSFFAFGTLCLISTVTSLLTNLSQVRYHIKHLKVCLSDLNENTLAMVASNIEESRKKDGTIKVLIGIAVIFGFVGILALLKAIIT